MWVLERPGGKDRRVDALRDLGGVPKELRCPTVVAPCARNRHAIGDRRRDPQARKGDLVDEGAPAA